MHQDSTSVYQSVARGDQDSTSASALHRGKASGQCKRPRHSQHASWRVFRTASAPHLIGKRQQDSKRLTPYREEAAGQRKPPTPYWKEAAGQRKRPHPASTQPLSLQFLSCLKISFLEKMAKTIFENFTEPLDDRWIQTCIGGGKLAYENSRLRMALESARQGEYSDAQIDDYGEIARSNFPWRPPLRMSVIARSSLPAATLSNKYESEGTLRGTAGFGFWNYPFSVKGDILMLPEAVWFFYASPPSNMALVHGIPGWGWKAQVVHTMNLRSLVATVPLAASIASGYLTGKTRTAAHWMQRVAGAYEALLPVEMAEWHIYTLVWLRSEALFWVDDALVLRSPHSPTRPLGFVTWLDNQYAIATPRGVLRFGTVSSGPQWLELESVKIEPLYMS